ncbi:hypothetical protein [Halorussus aquaticus]|uniref:Uncharacterized protein n=1 Tax=Halorussus aquaticus TaxID=2953748 RepID=A0ABD5Q325_9EURY|nr:hypothetical protein [Halorussus aquaticus]
MRRAALLTLAVVVLLSVTAVAPAAAQAQTQDQAGNETTTGSEPVNASDIDTSQIVQELGTVTVHQVEFEDSGLVKITVTATEHSAPIAVTDSGAVDIGSNERASVPFEVYRPGDGTHVLRFHLASDDALITIQEGGEMMAASGDRGTVDVMAAQPTADVVRWGTAGGAIGVLIATGLAVGFIKRKHENTYKELLSEERVRVEENPVEGLLGKVKRFVSHHRYALLAAASIVAYLVAVRLGVLPSLGDVWADMNDAQRVLSAAAGVWVILGFLPAYGLVTRVWEPAKEFVFDLDARDVLDDAIGSKGGLASLEDIESEEDAAEAKEDLEDQDITVAAVYSGSPDRVAQMRVDGAPAEIQTAGGPGHLVQDFDPKRNTADGTWPGLADDFELAKERSKIDANKEILEDWATVGRRVISAIPAIRAGSDTAAVASVDRKFGQNATVNPEPVDDIMDSAVSGTRFERFYKPDDGEGGEDDYEDDDAGDTVNDDGDGGDSE